MLTLISYVGKIIWGGIIQPGDNFGHVNDKITQRVFILYE